MKNNAFPQAEQYSKRRRRRKAWQKIVSGLACVVVFVTTYMLILPAITMEQTAYCGIEAHQHGDECKEKRLVCGFEGETSAHIHDSSCYQQEQVLVCGQEESPGHIHSESCIQRSQTLICTEDHEHTDACYQTVETYICGKDEGEGAHTHGAACYETRDVLVCGLTEGNAEHTHTDECYEEVLICEKTEHTHSLACYSNPEADLESRSVWERSVAGIELTGVWADDVIAIAGSQLGYTESTKNYAVTEAGEVKGYTRYGAWYGDPYGDWCAMFVSFCLYYAEIPETAVPYEESCADWIAVLSSRGLYQSKGSCAPEKGDLVFLDNSGGGYSDHMGLVAETDGTSLRVIEGNSADCVRSVSYSIGDSRILGYCALPENPEIVNEEEAPVEETEEALTENAGEESAEKAAEEKEPEALTESEIPMDEDPGVMLMAELEDDVVDSGTIEGTNLTWKITQNTSGEYTLTIDGEGAIPNYTDNSADRPWHSYNTTQMKLVLGDGVTEIGEYAFSRMKISSVDFGSGVACIGKRAFSYNSLKSVAIPGNIKTIKEGAFIYSQVSDITLEEGVETIESNAFGCNSTVGVTIYIPSTVKEIGGTAFYAAEQYIVSADNPYYCAVDGILYSKDMTVLVDYPQRKITSEYVVPESVTEIASGALHGVRIRKLYIPATVKTLPQRLIESSTVEEIYFEDDVLPTTTFLWFYTASNLRSIHLPENTSYTLTGTFYGGTYPNLTSFKFPNGVTKIATLGNSLSNSLSFPSLETVIYDTRDADITSTNIMGTDTTFDLTVGPSVDHLPANFSYFASHALDTYFAPENTFTADAGAFAGAQSPLADLCGTFYVDSQGLLYVYDVEAGTATLVYCPPGVTTAVIPGSITPEDGVTCTVTTVKQDALKLARDLTAIRFENPENIISLEVHAMANCPTLTSVNDKTTVEEATALFTNAEIGYGVFYNTGLGGAGGTGSFEADMDGKGSLTVSHEGATDLSILVSSGGETMKWVANEDGVTGGYRLLTGDTMTITASVGNTEGSGDNVYRVYLRLTDENGSLNIVPGQTYTFNGQTATCYATEDPYTVYLEFQLDTGATVSIPITAVYPSPDSPGGGLTVWGLILTNEEAAASSGKLMESASGSIQAYWTTQPDVFQLTKTGTGTAALTVLSDGNGGAQPSTTLNWQIKLERQTETTSAYGKDYVKSAEFTDVMTLPEGVVWREEVIEAIQNGKIYVSGNAIYAGDVLIANLSLSSGSGLVLTAKRIEWDTEQEEVILHWNITNTSVSAEMNASTFSLIIYPAALLVDMSTFTQGTVHTITNTADVTVHYHYSEDKELSASAEKTISGGAGNIKLTKTGTNATSFGEDITYTLDLYNDGGLPWTADLSGVYTLRDQLSQYSYISPENMERMFNEEYGGQLTVTIQNAVLASWQAVTGTDGTDSYQTSGNSDLGTEGNTLTVTKTEGGFTAVVTDGAAYTGSSVAEALQQAGYSVTDKAKYTCVWTLNEADAVDEAGEPVYFTLKSGEHRVFMVYATAKDTFQMLSTDWPNEYPSNSSVRITNQAYVYTSNNIIIISKSASDDVIREAYIAKSVYQDGVYLGKAPKASDRDVLEYHLDFTHYGSGSYEDLPMVDDLYGSQTLLVPVLLNPDLTGLEIFEEDGVQYYKLEEGTYTDVVVGVDDEGNNLTAASITVTFAENETEATVGGNSYTYTGLHTEIKWYFPHLDGGNYRITVTYKALVDLSLTGVNYTIGNVVWMNDRTGARIYDSLWGGGTIIQFDKDIVTEKGASFRQDVLDEDDYCLVEPGQQVTYRLTLHNTGTGYFYLNGKDLADVLPDTRDIFTWQQGVNLTDFRYEIDGTVDVNGLDDWYLGDGYAGLLGDRQYILWPETTEITFTEQSTIYLYFTLTYPADTSQGDTWSRYAAALGGGTLDNTLYVYRYPSVVTHNLRESGEVLLQKGVYGMYWSSSSTSSNNYPAGSSRLFYNNRDLKTRRIAYYVTLYNGGNKRLYLNDLYDQLPQGFTYIGLFSQWPANNTFTLTNTTTTYGGTTPAQTLPVQLGANVVYRSAKITATKTDGGAIFSIGAGSGSNALQYDEEQKQYYLDRGDAIVFGYLCDIGLSTETENSAVNTIAMAYTDHLDTGLQVIGKNEVSATVPDSENFADYNDGTRLVKTGQQVLADYGFGDGSNPEWLVSDVTVTRGGIIPGVTKYTESYTNSGGVTVDYTNSVGPNDTVNWRVRLHNSGTLSITDWTFTDIMPAPYVIEGNVTLQICDANGVVWNTITVATLPTNREGAETALVVQYGTNVRTVEFDGEWERLENDWSTQIALSRDENGNEVLKLWLVKSTLSIPEGGYVDISFSSRNPTNTYVNTVYTNQAMLTPNVQEFTTVQQGSMVRDADGKPVSAKNSSPVTVSFGYSTSSVKQVTETADQTNTAVSTDPDHNAILLPDRSSDFFYTLTVSNDTEKAMTKLVLMDNLPQVGDHSPFNTGALRGSEFQVSLAENPDFQITVTPESGETYTLDSQYYKIQYSTASDFGGPQSADWNGADNGTTAQWTDDPTGARAFRIVITDADGTQIPAKAKISVTFHAMVDSDAQPGQIAWNSFGYHYALQGIDTELEAMPLVVGVQIPSVPSLQKRLVDSNGQSVEAPADAVFSFLIYEGTALEGGYDTADALKAALTEAGRDWEQFDLPVKAGETASEAVYLDWTWTAGETYTVVELPAEEAYAFHVFSGSGGAARTFSYDPAVSQVLVCENTLLHWAVSLTKQDNEGALLSGAVFALYSPEESDQLQELPEEYRNLDVTLTLEQNAQTWYLSAIGTTGADGILSWDKLLRENYYLLEVKAPDGYNLSNPAGQILYRSGAKDGVYALTVVNYAGYELPETGGAGTDLYSMGGLLLTLCAGTLLLYIHARRRKEDAASS